MASVKTLAPLPAANISLFERPGILRREWFLWMQGVDLTLRTLLEEMASPSAATRLADGVAAPAAEAGSARIYVDTADGDLKVVFGDGTVKTIVTDT